jgi:uncharacterized protein (TIGR02145 family)
MLQAYRHTGLIVVIALAGSLGACSALRPGDDGRSIRDKNGNSYTVIKMPDGKYWTAANINTDLPASFCYDSLGLNCDKYGRLYTWKTAIMVCGALGTGWRLPSGDDWRALAKCYGGVFKEPNDNGKDAYFALTEGGASSFNALLGGGHSPNGDYWRLGAHGFYWTSTETNDTTAWFINFGKGRPALYLQNDGEKDDAFAVRCVKE